MAIAVAGCESSTSELLSDELISSNLSKDGEIDPELLIGEWDIIEFAYTADGKKISDVATLTGGRLSIPFAPTPKKYEAEDRWRLSYFNSWWFICSLSGNLIKLQIMGSTYALGPPEENEIVSALQNSYSYVIKGNELFIYFTKVDNKNLLILKRL